MRGRAGPLPLRRLTRTEYDNTVRDLLGDDSAPARVFPAEARSPSGFFAPGEVGPTELERFDEAAAALAARAVAQLESLSGCKVTVSGERACTEALIVQFGRRAYRRPVAADERADLLRLYHAVRAAPLTYGHEDAARVVVRAMLNAPGFLYHLEEASPATLRGTVIELDGHRLASRLSYLLWASMPDAALFEAVNAGRLRTRQDVGREARRMLGDPRARSAAADFLGQWVDEHKLDSLPKDPKAYPAFDNQLRTSMRRELDAFAAFALLEDGRLETLLTSPVAFVDGPLARLYGVAAPAGDALERRALDPDRRPGLLGRAAFLTIHANTYETSPVKRGKVVRERLLCQTLPPPPPGAEDAVPPPAPNQQTRERYAAHSDNAACRDCHTLMDPIGFALEGLDGIGRERTMDAGRPVDTRATLADMDGRTVTVNGPAELARALLGSASLRTCFVKQWWRYIFGRLETADEAPYLAALERAMGDASATTPDMLVSIVMSEAFLTRSPSPEEVTR